MAQPLKDLYSPQFFAKFNTVASQSLKTFDSARFLKLVHDADWHNKELKARAKHIAAALKDVLSNDYDQAIDQIERIINGLIQNNVNPGIEFLFFPEYIELFGLKHYTTSMRAIEFVTQFITCEYAVRPFIEQHPDKMMKQMLRWSRHKNLHVRRLASEGCRPRLPWGMALKQLKLDPTPILPILENLKNDSSDFVRRSVANNLNDIAKDNPDVVLKIIKAWKGSSAHADWIVKHGSRTLLRKAHPAALSLFGLPTSKRITISALKLTAKRIAVGGRLHFSFTLINNESKPIKLRVEYGIDYMKSNGKTNRKLFKITENTYHPGEVYSFTRSQSFTDFTTRKHYPGGHKLAIVVNGQELCITDFTVTR